LERNSDQLAKLDMTIWYRPVVASTVWSLHRRHLAVREAREVELVLRIGSKRPPIRRPSRSLRIDQQAGKRACSQDACRGGVVREDGAMAAESVLSTGPTESGRGCGGNCAARKLGVMIYVLTNGTEYAYARPDFTVMKLRKAKLKAGAAREYGKAGPGRDYWIKEIREREAGYVKRAEQAYERMVAARKERPVKSKALATAAATCWRFPLLNTSVVRQMRPS
jgi:hypothetical protein